MMCKMLISPLLFFNWKFSYAIVLIKQYIIILLNINYWFIPIRALHADQKMKSSLPSSLQKVTSTSTVTSLHVSELLFFFGVQKSPTSFAEHDKPFLHRAHNSISSFLAAWFQIAVAFARTKLVTAVRLQSAKGQLAGRAHRLPKHVPFHLVCCDSS